MKLEGKMFVQGLKDFSLLFFFKFFNFGIGSLYAAQAGLEFMIILPVLPKSWDYKHKSPCLDFCPSWNDSYLISPSQSHHHMGTSALAIQVFIKSAIY
jgi:hypothetical protein